MNNEAYKFATFKTEFFRGLPWTSFGYMNGEILPELKGRQWNDYTLAIVSAFNPTAIRLARDFVTCDSYTGRITVYLDENDLIRIIEQEIEVPLPPGTQHGSDLIQKSKEKM